MEVIKRPINKQKKFGGAAPNPRPQHTFYAAKNIFKIFIHRVPTDTADNGVG
jgi:hypothetical protein